MKQITLGTVGRTSISLPAKRGEIKHINRRTLWTPELLQPALWLDASDTSTITLENGAVSEWRDKSGNELHAIQTSSSNRPLFVQDGLNSTSIINFNGSTRLNHSYSGPSQATLFVVAKTNATSSWRCLGAFGPNLNMYINYSGPNWGHFSSGHSGNNANSFSIMSIERNPSNIVYRHNASSLVSSNLTTYSNGITTIGARNSSGTESGLFDVSQIIIIPRVLTLEEKEAMEGYLAHKTGLQENLPAYHLYKLSPPRK